MELILKQILPILLFAYLFFFEYKKNSDIFLILILFCGYISFSSNYAFPIYRVLYQLIQVAIFIIYLAKYRFDFLKTKTGKWLIIYFLFILMSSIGNKFNQEYWISVLNFATIFFVIAFLNKNINDLKKLYRLLSFINRLVFVVAIFTIIAFAFERVRIELTTNNTNYLAYFLGIGFSIALFLPESKKSKIIPPVIGLAILCTSSRIVVISSVIIILIYILSRKRKRVLNLLLIALALITTVGFVDISKYFDQSRYANINQDASTVERIEIIQTSKKIIAENPVNGIGYSQFQYEFLHYVSKNTEYLANAEEIVTHNDFIRVIDELGLPALVFFLYMIITQFVILWKLPAVLRLLLVGVFISNISYSTSHNNLNSFVFWFLLTLPGMVSYLISKEKYVKKIR